MKNAEIRHEGFKANLFIGGIDMGEMEKRGNTPFCFFKDKDGEDYPGYSSLCFVKDRDKDGNIPQKIALETTQSIDHQEQPDLGIATNKVMNTPENSELNPVESTDLLAVFHIQHPLTGDTLPVMRPVDKHTTIAELIEWQKRNANNPHWKESWVDIRILPSSR